MAQRMWQKAWEIASQVRLVSALWNCHPGRATCQAERKPHGVAAGERDPQASSGSSEPRHPGPLLPRDHVTMPGFLTHGNCTRLNACCSKPLSSPVTWNMHLTFNHSSYGIGGGNETVSSKAQTAWFMLRHICHSFALGNIIT